MKERSLNFLETGLLVAAGLLVLFQFMKPTPGEGFSFFPYSALATFAFFASRFVRWERTWLWATIEAVLFAVMLLLLNALAWLMWVKP